MAKPTFDSNGRPIFKRKVLNEQQGAIKDFLANSNIEFRRTLVGYIEHEDWKHCLWSIWFLNRITHKQQVFEYKTGMGINEVPCEADVLYCLLSDAECGNYNFHDFCDNLGYDNDSIKSLNIYKACLEQTEKLKTIFSNSDIEHLRELLEDY